MKTKLFFNKSTSLNQFLNAAAIIFIMISCSKVTTPVKPIPIPPTPTPFTAGAITINGKTVTTFVYNINTSPIIKFNFSSPINASSVASSITFTNASGGVIAYNASYADSDTVVIIQPASPLNNLTKYIINVSTTLQSKDSGFLTAATAVNFVTQIDSTDKFTRISDSALLDLVQQQTLKYFYDFAHPVSGMARERNSSGDIVTTGGTGFGIMSMIAGVNRNFITRSQGLEKISTIVSFLKDRCTRFHGAFSHWIDGSTGATVPFSQYDDGGDLVETSYLLQGLLSARQYFNTSDANETLLRKNIDSLYNGVEWSWYRQGGQNALFWHWSPNYGFKINQQISGWDEALIVYVLAASSNVDSIPKIVYDNGWALNGGIKNGKSFYGIQLPLGPDFGGPLFFSQYSFLGINPNGLTDAYANYLTQNTNHTLINYTYCVTDPKGYFGYSNLCWGLTASDQQNGYSAHAPDNDNGVISPTAAISSLPYTPTQSLNALRFFYYTLGDKIWGDYGFKDAFNLSTLWFASSYLAIDQGPQIVMIENYRTGLLWNLFMSSPEIKRGMKNLGFQSPYL